MSKSVKIVWFFSLGCAIFCAVLLAYAWGISKGRELELKDDESKKNDIKIEKYELFNEKNIFSDKCIETSCNENLGKFSLNNKVYNASFNYEASNKECESYCNPETNECLNEQIGELKLGNNSIFFSKTCNYIEKLEKIVKYNENYLFVYVSKNKLGETINPIVLYIYDDNLNMIKEIDNIYSYGESNSEYNVCSMEDDNEKSQKIDKYKLSLEDGVFLSENIDSEYKECY